MFVVNIVVLHGSLTKISFVCHEIAAGDYVIGIWHSIAGWWWVGVSVLAVLAGCLRVKVM
jgi:hypothetical protein